MNRKAEAFKKYLEEKNITCFVIDKITDDKLNTVVFRSYIVLFSVRVQIAGNVLNEKNELAVLKEINKLNRQYKVFKYYFTDDGSLFLDSCLLNKTGQADGDMIYTVLDVIIKHLQKEYSVLMQLIWQ